MLGDSPSVATRCFVKGSFDLGRVLLTRANQNHYEIVGSWPATVVPIKNQSVAVVLIANLELVAIRHLICFDECLVNAVAAIESSRRDSTPRPPA
jgi:hypothetical protein